MVFCMTTIKYKGERKEKEKKSNFQVKPCRIMIHVLLIEKEDIKIN